METTISTSDLAADPNLVEVTSSNIVYSSTCEENHSMSSVDKEAQHISVQHLNSSNISGASLSTENVKSTSFLNLKTNRRYQQHEQYKNSITSYNVKVLIVNGGSCITEKGQLPSFDYGRDNPMCVGISNVYKYYRISIHPSKARLYKQGSVFYLVSNVNKIHSSIEVSFITEEWLEITKLADANIHQLPCSVRCGVVLQLQDGPDHGKILLVKGKDYDGVVGKWGYPKGMLEPGETFEDAARRELFEETCIGLTQDCIITDRSIVFNNDVFYYLFCKIDYREFKFNFLLSLDELVDHQLVLNLNMFQHKETNVFTRMQKYFINVTSTTSEMYRNFSMYAQMSNGVENNDEQIKYQIEKWYRDNKWLLFGRGSHYQHDVSCLGKCNKCYFIRNTTSDEFEDWSLFEKEYCDEYYVHYKICTCYSSEVDYGLCIVCDKANRCMCVRTLDGHYIDVCDNCYESPYSDEEQSSDYSNDYIEDQEFVLVCKDNKMWSFDIYDETVGDFVKRIERDLFIRDIYLRVGLTVLQEHYRMKDYVQHGDTVYIYHKLRGGCSKMSKRIYVRNFKQYINVVGDTGQDLLDKFSHIKNIYFIQNGKIIKKDDRLSDTIDIMLSIKGGILKNNKEKFIGKTQQDKDDNYISHGNLYLYKLFRTLRGKRHGDKRRLLWPIHQMLVRKQLCLSFNTREDILLFCKMLKRYGMKYIHVFDAKAQMFTIAYTVADGLNAVAGGLNKAKDTVVKGFNAVRDLNEVIAYVNSAFESIRGSIPVIVEEFVQFLTKTIGFIYVLNHNNLDAYSITALIIATFSGYVSLKTVIESLTLAVKAVAKLKCQMTDETTNVNFITSFVNVVTCSIKGIFSSLDPTAVGEFEIHTKLLNNIVRAFKNVSNIFEICLNIISHVMEYFGNYLISYYNYIPGFMKDQKNLEALVEKFGIFEKNDYLRKSKYDEEVAKFTISLYNEITTLEEKLLKKMYKNADRVMIFPYIRAMKCTLQQAMDAMPPSMKSINGRRPKPFWLAIVGEPRIGKTTWLQEFIIARLCKKLGLVGQYQDQTTFSHNRVCGAEFWDGYANQPVVVYDDLFQVYANQEQVYTAIDEITKVVNDCVYPLNMAAVTSKGQWYFTSKVVISNMQKDLVGQTFLSNKCLSGGQHILSRRNVVIELLLDPKYKTADGTLNQEMFNSEIVRQTILPITDEKGLRVDQHRFGCVYNVIPYDAYRIQFHNPKTGDPIDFTNFMEYKNKNGISLLPIHYALDIIEDMAVSYFNKSNFLNTVITDTAQKLYAAQMYCGDDEDDDESDYTSVVADYDPVRTKKDCFHCHKCSFKTGDSNAYDEHYWDEHPRDKNSQLKCIFCNERFKYSAGLILHVKERHCVKLDERYDLWCSLCNYEIQDSCVARKHLLDVHGYDVKYDDHGKNLMFTDPVTVSTYTHIHKYRLLPDPLAIHSLSEYTYATIDKDNIPSVLAFLNTPQQDMICEQMCDACCCLHTLNYDRRNGNITTARFVELAMQVINNLEDHQCHEYSVNDVVGVPPFQNPKRSLYMKVHEVVADFVARSCHFVANNKFMLVFGIATLLSGIAAYMVITKETKEEVCENEVQSSSKKKLRRGATRQNRRARETQSIHEIDRKQVVIGSEAQMYNKTNTNVEDLLAKSFVRLRFLVRQNDVEEYCDGCVSAVNVFSSVFMVPKHFVDRIRILGEIYGETAQVYIVFEISDGMRRIIPMKDVHCVDNDVALPMSAHIEDIQFIYIQGLMLGRDKRKHFVSINDEINLYGSYLYGIRSENIDNKHIIPSMLTLSDVNLMLNQSCSYELSPAVAPFTKQKINSSIYTLPDSYMYTSNTVAGDCGMLLLNSDHTCPRKIMGVHTAGSVTARRGIANPIYQEDLDDLYNYLQKVFPTTFVSRQAEPDYTIAEQPKNSVLYNAMSSMPNLRIVGPIDKINYNGEWVKPVIRLPSDSKIKPSIDYEILTKELGEPTYFPAALKPFTVDEKVVSPLLNGLSKMSNFSIGHITNDECSQITSHIIDTMLSWKSPHVEDRRILTDYETFNGYEGLNPVDVTTSPGLPYTILRKTVGKKDYISTERGVNGKNIYVPSEQLLSDINTRLKLAEEGIIKDSFFIDSLKDETREKEKVELGKTRLFQIGPMDLVLLTRKYCGKFISHCHSTYIDGEMAIGISPYSEDWNLLAKSLKRFDLYLNGDYSNYDATISLQFAFILADIINGWYPDDEDIRTKMVRTVIVVACFIGNKLAYECLYEALQGNPSGCALTTIINCLVNMVLLRLFFMRETKMSLDEYLKHVLGKFYGDDNLVGLSRIVAQVMTMPKYEKFVETFGMKYTSVTKDAIKADHVLFEDLSFLCNSFKYVHQLGNYPVNKYAALLDSETIRNIAYWAENDNVEDQMNRYNMSLYFALNHGLEYFRKLRKAFVRCILENNKKGYSMQASRLFTFRHCFALQYPNLIDYVDLDDDKTKSSSMLVTINDCEVTKLGQPMYLNNGDRASYLTINNMNLKFLCQMSGISDDHQTVEQITVFQETGEVSSSSASEKIQQIARLPADLSRVICRPIRVANFAWSTSDTIGTQKSFVLLPKALWSSSATFLNKISGFAFWAPDIEITVRVNGTPMHFGRLLICSRPLPETLPNAYNSYRNATSYPWVQVDASSSNSAVLRVPFNHYNEFLSVGADNESIAGIYTYVAAPLAIINSVASNIQVQIFARIIEPRFNGYTYTNDFAAQMSTPIVKQSIAAGVKTNPLKFAITDHNNKEESDLDLIDNYCNHPFLIRNGSISTSTAAGSMITVRPIAPQYMVYNDALTYTGLAPSPIAYVANVFEYWRSDMTFTVSFVKSNFHNARIAIWYVPFISSSFNPSGITVDNILNCENIILDLSERSEITFKIPFQQRTNYASTGNSASYSWPGNYQYYTNGCFGMSLINPLTTPDGSADTVFYQIFMRPDNTHFSYPNTYSIGSYGYIAQMESDLLPSSSVYSSETACRFIDHEFGKAVPFRHNSTVVTRFTELAQMCTFFDYLGVSNIDTAAKIYVYNPAMPMPMRYNIGERVHNMYCYVGCLFRFWRGSINYLINPDMSAAGKDQNMARLIMNVFSYPTASANSASTNSQGSQLFFPYAYQYAVKSDEVNINLALPYDSIYAKLPTCFGATSAGPYTNLFNYPSIIIALTVPDTGTKYYSLSLGAGKDIEFHVRGGVPIINT